MTEAGEKAWLIYLAGFGVAMVVLLLASSVAVHRSWPWVHDADRVGALTFYVFVWPLALAVLVVWVVLRGLHYVIGLVAKPRPVIAPPQDEHLASALREVERLTDGGS